MLAMSTRHTCSNFSPKGFKRKGSLSRCSVILKTTSTVCILNLLCLFVYGALNISCYKRKSSSRSGKEGVCG